jgi:uncharacterized membrane protein
VNNDVLIFVPNIILLILTIIYVWRRHSLKDFDWVTLGCITLGVSLLAIVIALFLKNHEQVGPVQILLISIPPLAFVLFLLFLTRVFTVEKVKSRFHMDERITHINAKSARNALVAVYLSALINLIIFSTISTGLLLEILGVSLAVYLASMVIYSYRDF